MEKEESQYIVLCILDHALPIIVAAEENACYR